MTESSNIDDRTMRELYTHPFLRAVAADVAAVMCSYNRINSSWACQNAEGLNGILKTDFGFQGYVMSDWYGTHSGVSASVSGLDMDMPGDIYNTTGSFFGANLTKAVYNGSVPQDRLDDMAQRVMAAYYLMGQDQDFPEVNFDSNHIGGENNSHVDVREQHGDLIRKIGAASTVLLKNVNNTLPLNKPRSIALIGEDMGPPRNGPNGYDNHGGLSGTLAVGWGSGTASFTYLVDPLQAFSQQVLKDGSSLTWNIDNTDPWAAGQAAIGSEVAIVGVASDSGEDLGTAVEGLTGDRNELDLWHNGTEIILSVAANHSNVVVVVHAVGPVIMEEWIDHPNVTAVVWAGLPGQETGNSLLDVLYGSYNPSAKLPYTIAKDRSDYPADVQYNLTGNEDVNYTEKLNIDYRHFLSENITPRYPFGFGLSYTQFEISGVSVETKENAQDSTEGVRELGGFLADW